MKSEPEELLAFQLRASRINYRRQYKAITGRKFLFDFRCWQLPSNADILVEVQGGIWRKKGAHNTGKAITRDCEKLNLAVIAGYRVLHVTPEHVKSGQALKWIEDALV